MERRESIPLALIQSDDYSTLSLHQKKTFSSRIADVRSITARLRGITNIQLRVDIDEAVDNVELDIYSVLSLRDLDAHVSAYIIHHSWTFLLTSADYQMVLTASGLRGDLDNLIGKGYSDIVVLMSNYGDIADRIFVMFEEAPSSSIAVACLVAIDYILASVLRCCILLKFK